MPDMKEYSRKYNHSKKGKARYKKYRQSSHGKAKLKEAYEERKKLFSQIQSQIGCVFCGETDPLVLRFYLRDSQRAKFLPDLQNISRSLKDWFEVLKNCDVLCANCSIKRKKKAKQIRDLVSLICA
jgi:hypothetical protein